VSTTLREFSEAGEDGDSEQPWCVEHDAEEWCESQREAGDLPCFDHFGGGA